MNMHGLAPETCCTVLHDIGMEYSMIGATEPGWFFAWG
jgi:hypothetical protein